MRIHGLLSFYDEPIPALVACIQGLHKAGIDHLVALDGRYNLYPGNQAASHPNQHAAIHLACRNLGIDCTLSAPTQPWEGNEVEKRTRLFALAWACAQPEDWFWVQDADMVVTHCAPSVRAELETTPAETAEVTILDVVAQQAQQKNWPETFACRSLFRAQPITVGPAHCNYNAADGRDLWNGSERHADVSKLDLTDLVVVEHRPHERPHERQAAKQAYYVERDAAGIERGPCETCDRRSVKLVPVNWRMTDLGAVALWQEACGECAPEWEQRSRSQLEGLGLDPDRVSVENRNGHIPAPTN